MSKEEAEISNSERLILQAQGLEDMQALIAIVSLGMCRALADGAVCPEYACARLFGPALLTRMRRLHVGPLLTHAVHVATELEDVSNIAPHALDDALQELEVQLLTVIRSLAEPSDGERWLAPPEADTRETPRSASEL